MQNTTSVTRRPTRPAALARRPTGTRRHAADWRFRQQPRPAEAHAGGVAQNARARRRVLVVDDESAIRALCRVNLSVSGMEVIEAADGETALELARAEDPDLILLDVMLPGTTGWEVATELAASAATREIPVIFLSAMADVTDLERGRSHGAVGYVTKPFDPVGIADVIEETLRRIARGERQQLRDEITDNR
ncbi:MAG: response regulator transcription factor [Gaiellaceae bacterium]